MLSVRSRLPSLPPTILATMLLVAGCASASPVSAQHPPQPGHILSLSPDGQGRRAVRVEHDGSNGKTISVRVGDRITLILASEYWTIRGSSAPTVLRQEGPTKTLAPSPRNCPPGVGCRPLRTLFAALAPGTAVITAHRRTCGEALRCVGSQGHYRLTVIVTAP
jgi:hypothetical protein